MKYYVWLQEVLGAGNHRVKKILQHFGSAEAIYNSKKEDLIKSGCFTEKELSRISSLSLDYAEEIVDICLKNNIKIIRLGEENYPNKFLELPNPPLVIYIKGVLPDFDNIPSISVVGPRKVSDLGKKAAFSLSCRLALAGFIIVSGGALGTDSYAHAGALKCDGVTVLILGCGILRNYLPENKRMREAIVEKGCLISEYPPNEPPSKYTFPVRNRLLSVLTLGTVVVEAPQKSGSLITANYACEQGKDVFVIPGPPNSKEYAGSNNLLREGAKPIIDLSDIFNEYIKDYPDKINIKRAYEKPILGVSKSEKVKKDENFQKNLNEILSKEAKIVYNCIDKQKFSPEEIINTGLDANKLLSALTELEMEFLIRALPGGMYEKCD